MPHVLETGFEVIEGSNPNGSPRIRGYNIINGQLTEAKDGGTFDYRDEYVTNVPSEYNRQIDNVRKAAAILGLTAAIPAEVGLPNEESAVR